MSQRQGKAFCIGVSRAHCNSFELDLKGEGIKIRYARNKLGDSLSVLKGECASEVLQSAISVEAGD